MEREKKKITLAIGILFATTLFGGSVSNAIEGTFSGRIEILQSLSITEDTALDFGQVNKPSTGANTVTLSQAGLVTIAGAGDGFAVPGTASVGEYTLSGEASQNFVASVEIVDFTDAGINVLESHINGITDTHAAALDATGSYDLVIAGAVEVTSSASLGVHTTDVVLTANYE